jgi:hypothetical protein
MTEEEQAVARLAAWKDSPVLFVREVFDAEPDAWQVDVLRALPTEPRIAMSACKGPGKSTLKAWCAWWILTCHQDAQGIATSITGENLRDGLWKELAVWHAKSEFLQSQFTINTERVASVERPKTWFLSARTFPRQADPEQQANTLAGLHAETVFILLDEVGDYPPGVVSAAEGIFANVARSWLIVGGNPTRVGGALHIIVERDAEHWFIVHITGDPDDPKRSPRINLEWAEREIDKWGRDNPWVMTNILGLFPPASSDQLISVNDVTRAMEHDVPLLAYRADARVWGLDPARFGDDESALCRRQGVVCRVFHTWRNLDGNDLGDQVSRLILEAEKNKEPPDAIFVDVGGVGASCFDRLKILGWDELIMPVDFGGRASDRRFVNKRAEIWWQMADWLKRRPSCLPSDAVLRAELPRPRFKFRVVNKQTAFVLEGKDEMRKRGVPSPNRADALALTFSAPVQSRSREERDRRSGPQTRAKTEYDPFARP